MIRRTLTWLAIGAVIGIIFSMWFGPSFVRWWWLPPGPGGAMFTGEQVTGAAAWLVKVQAIVCAIFAVFFAVIANLVTRRHVRPPTTTETPSSPTARRTSAPA